MRNMSFSKTTGQARDRSKIVTRRWGWWFLKPGDKVQQVEKCMGLKLGEKVKKIHVIEITSVGEEPLGDITDDECVREGLELLTVTGLQDLLRSMKPKKFKGEHPNRIEFKYVD
ncbi:hypothetical protein LCGC14_0357710 [marine sediment metagenome]|uniref:ASCH domain-containing protein n=1 Tax=marine sediment metagenome TaxID=412755 RepID=A0A0F9VW10_9ZZZZ